MTTAARTTPWTPVAVSWRDDVRAALPGWIAARVVVAGALAVAKLVELWRDGPLTQWQGFARRGLLGWDADWYQRIAVHGYGSLPDESLRFFPLMPLLARLLGVGTWIGAGVALVLVANAAALVAGALVHRLAIVAGADARTAWRAATCFALAPPAFVLVMGYSESVALALALGCMVALLMRRPVPAGVAGFFAGLARPTGVLLAVPALVIWVGDERTARLSARERIERVATVLAPLAGTATYLAWCRVTAGDWLKPFSVQNVPGLRGSVVNPFQTIGAAVRDLVLLHPTGHQITVLLTVALVVAAARRWPVAVTAWGAAALLVAFSAERLGSIERYAWGAVTPVLALAVLGPRSWRRVLPVVLAAGLAVLATLAFTGEYVP
jgi:hypothetical protein